MAIYNISEARARLSALIARLVAYRERTEPRKPGAMAGEIRIAPDFDTLPDDIAVAMGAIE